MRSSWSIILLLTTFTCFAQVATSSQEFVPDKATAIRVAEAIEIPTGPGQERHLGYPLRASLNGDVWEVEETLICAGLGCKAAAIRISRRTGAISLISTATADWRGVQSADTALQIAKAIWQSSLGTRTTDGLHACHANLKDRRWVVLCYRRGQQPVLHLKGGGMPIIEIDEDTAAVLSLYYAR